MSWFHCGRCGSLFQSKSGDLEQRLCSKCGFDPNPNLQTIAELSESRSIPSHPAHSDQPRKHKTRPHELERGKARTMTWVLSVLVVLLVGSGLYMAPFLWDRTPEKSPVSSAPAAPEVSEADMVLLNEAMPKCSQAFSAFLAAGTTEARSQFVLDPISTASRMTRFYSLNPSINIDPQSLEFVGRSIVRLPGSTAIETHWKVQNGDEQFDAVFREQNGEWRLDWDHFARFSDFPWALFLAGTGPPEGEFRLLARERLANERKNAENISIVLYAPRFGHPEEAGLQSPEFLLSRTSRDGKLLDTAFQLARSNERVFGSLLPAWNPDRMTRVRVKVRRVESDMGRKFEIIGITACHWYSVDDPGIELNAADEAPPVDAPPAEN